MHSKAILCLCVRVSVSVQPTEWSENLPLTASSLGYTNKYVCETSQGLQVCATYF